jgi:ABC-type sulfate transport system permease subunit
MDVIASNFLTGAILTLVVPLALLVGVCIWWVIALRRGAERGS